MNAATVRPAQRLPWAQLGVGVAAVLALYAPLLPRLAAEWAQFPSLSHGYAIPLIAAYLIWVRRERLAAEPLGSSPLGLPVVVLGLAMLVAGSLAGEPFLARLGLLPALFGAVLFLAGSRIARQVWMGIGYLVFMLPLPYTTLKAVTYQSRLFDATMTAHALEALGVPVLQDGVLLHLPNISLEVADDCSSIPAIAALVALGAAYAQVGMRPSWMRVALTLAAAPLGLLSNIARIVITSLGAYYFGRIALDNFIHKAAGTSVFLATVVLLVVLDGALAWVGARRRR